MTSAEARFNNSLRPRKPEGSLGRTAARFLFHNVHGGEKTLRAQSASFNTSDKWGHKTSTQSKKRKDDREKG